MPEPNQPADFEAQPLSDEYLSAYVDGELQGEALEQVERRLAEDSAARQLVDELRALSGELQSLPPATVGESLRATVMQRAERAMLLGNDEQPNLAPRHTGSSRRWVWAAMALAATLLLSLYLPSTQTDEQPIASAKPLPEESPAQQMRLEATEPAVTAERRQPTDQLAKKSATIPSKITMQVEDAAPLAGEQDGYRDLAAKSSGVGGGGHSGADLAGADESSAGVASAAVPSAAKAPPAMRSATAIADLAQSEDQTQLGDATFACEVHITMGDGEKSIAKVDRILERAGIALSNDRQAVAQAGEESFADSVSTTRAAAKVQSDQQALQYVLVEAPLQPIETALAACNLDTFNCPTIRVVDHSDQPAPAASRLRQWERAADETAATDKPPAELGVEVEPPADTAEQLAENQASRQQLGRATRLDRAELKRARLEQSKRRTTSRPQASVPRGAFSARGATNDPIQVLFVLHPAADLRKPPSIESEPESELPDER